VESEESMQDSRCHSHSKCDAEQVNLPDEFVAACKCNCAVWSAMRPYVNECTVPGTSVRAVVRISFEIGKERVLLSRRNHKTLPTQSGN
jgi:hypothetical protein